MDEKKKQKIICSKCGVSVSKNYLKKHKKTKRCIKIEEAINNVTFMFIIKDNKIGTVDSLNT